MKPDELRDLLDFISPYPWTDDNGYRVRSAQGETLVETKHFDTKPNDNKLISMAPELANEILRLHALLEDLVKYLEEPCGYIEGHQCAEVGRTPLCPVCAAREAVE